MRIRVVDGEAGFAELEAKWRDLEIADEAATPFQTYDWLSVWWDVYGGLRRAIFLAVEDGADLVGLFPVYQTRGAWSALRPMGHGISDYLQPLAVPSHRTRVYHEIGDWLRRAPGVDLVDLHQIREGFDVPGLNGPVIAEARCLVLDLPPTLEEYLQTLGKSLRYDVKRLAKLPVAIEETTSETVDEALDLFFSLHQQRWKKRGLPGAFVGTRVKEFHRRWARLALARDRFWLSTLRHEGEAVGSIYAMRTNQTCFFYQAGFDPAAKALSPGTLLVADAIRRSIEAGLTRFDFLRGDEPYKRRWKPQHEFENRRQMHAVSSWGRVAMRVNLAEASVEEKVRARLEGRGLFEKSS